METDTVNDSLALAVTSKEQQRMSGYPDSKGALKARLVEERAAREPVKEQSVEKQSESSVSGVSIKKDIVEEAMLVKEENHIGEGVDMDPDKVTAGNRVKEICFLTEHEDWRHILVEYNPVVLPSRGCHTESLLMSGWWEDPPRLELEAEEWPTTDVVAHKEAKKEEKGVCPGNLKFLGKLFKLCILTEKSMHGCLIKWLKGCEKEDNFDCLYKLSTTSRKAIDNPQQKSKIDVYFIEMKKL